MGPESVISLDLKKIIVLLVPYGYIIIEIKKNS